MRNVISVILLTFMSLSCYAQKFTEDDAIIEISEAAAALHTMHCNFTQTKSLKMLGENMVSKGKLDCNQPDKLRWEYTMPYNYIFILNGTHVEIKKDKQSDVIDVNQNKLFKEIVRIMMNSLLGKCLSDKKSFKATVVQSGNSYIATLIPMRREMKDMFSKIVLYYNRSAKVINKVLLHEKNGDSTTIELIDIRTNINIDASVFKID